MVHSATSSPHHILYRAPYQLVTCSCVTRCKPVILHSTERSTVESSLVLQSFEIVGDQLVGVSNGNQLVFYDDIDRQVSVCVRMGAMCVYVHV